MTLKESLISGSHRADIAEDQAQALIVRAPGLQSQLNVQPYQVSYANGKSLVKKEWEAQAWDGDI